MKFFETLWDLVAGKHSEKQHSEKRQREEQHVSVAHGAFISSPSLHPLTSSSSPRPALLASPRPLPPPRRPRETKDALYDRMTREMLARYQIRVRKWRTSMSGIAWYVEYRDGRIQRLIEAPRPRSPMSAAIFLHEVGHHAIGFDVYKPRCREEFYAWQYAFEQMEAWKIEVTPRVRTRFEKSMKYAVGKARRRGIKQVPAELAAWA